MHSQKKLRYLYFRSKSAVTVDLNDVDFLFKLLTFRRHHTVSGDFWSYFIFFLCRNSYLAYQFPVKILSLPLDAAITIFCKFGDRIYISVVSFFHGAVATFSSGLVPNELESASRVMLATKFEAMVNFKNACFSGITDALLRFRALKSPHKKTQLFLHTVYACEAGIDTRSNTTGATV